MHFLSIGRNFSPWASLQRRSHSFPEPDACAMTLPLPSVVSQLGAEPHCSRGSTDGRCTLSDNSPLTVLARKKQFHIEPIEMRFALYG